jgi:hypothetical protein
MQTDDELKRMLRAWKVEAELPRAFNREVWLRIATEERKRNEALLPSLTAWLFSAIAHPKYALALVALSLTAGVALAHMEAQETKAQHWKALEARYSASINPLAMTN